jgi:uncharacterized protein (DUF1778 family)
MQDVAEPKPVAKKKAKRTKPGKTRRPVAVVIKGSAEWKAWLEEAADHCRTTVSAFLDTAAVEYAMVRGFKKEPPKR